MSVATANETRRIGSDGEAIELAHAYADSIAAGAIDRDRERRVPVEELEQLGRSGLLTLGIPTEWGGPGARAETIVEVFRAISAADPAIGQVPQNHYQLVDSVVRYGSEEQKRLLLGDVVGGARFGNALSERGGKSPVDVRTTLRADGSGGYRLDGRKYYSTGALTARWVPVLAKREDDTLAFVFVPRDADGVEVSQDWTAFGQRATVSGTTALDDVAVRPEWVLPLPEREAADTFAAFAQILHAAVDVGISRGALEDAVGFLNNRSRAWFEAGVERPSEESHVVVHFGRLQTRVRAAETLLADAARRLDLAAADPDPARVRAARLGVAEARAFGAETALDVSSEAIDVLGASAADQEHGLDRHWRNARTHTLHDPTRWKYVHIGGALIAAIDPAPDNFLI